MKYRTYVLTYLAYAINHALRMCLSQNKSHIKQAFQVTSFYLGILDAAVYISYGIGTIFRYSFFGDRNLTKLYLISSILISLFYAVTPLVSSFVQSDSYTQNKTLINLILTISLAGYGFFHLAIWQITVTLVSQYWHANKDGCMMGFWATMSCMGNIIGFALPNFMIHTLKIRWQISMLLFAILNIVIALLMHMLITNPGDSQNKNQLERTLDNQNINQSITNNQSHNAQKQNQQKQRQKGFNKKVKTSQFLSFSKNKFLSQPDFRLYLFSYVTLKAVVYSFLMWYPIFLANQGYDNVSGYISMLFDVSSIFGGIFIGKLSQYEKLVYNQTDQWLKNKSLLVRIFYFVVKLRYFLAVAISIFLIIFYFIVPASITFYCTFTVLLGLTIGGMFHLYVAFNMMLYGGQTPRTVDMVSNFCIAIGCIGLGLFQLIIGLITGGNSKEKHSSNYKNFFYLLLTLMVISSIILYFKATIQTPSYYHNKKQFHEQQQPTSPNNYPSNKKPQLPSLTIN